MNSGDQAALVAFERALGPVFARIRLLRALRGLALYATLGGLAASVAGLLVAAGWLDPSDRVRCWILAALLALLGLALGASRRPALLSVALLVDRSHPFGGRIAAGVELAASGAGGEMGQLAVADGLACARRIEPQRALSITAPSGARAALLAGLAGVVGAALDPPTSAFVPNEARGPSTLRPLAVHTDDLAALREALAALPERPRPAARQAQIAEINALIEALSRRELDRAEALRRLGAIADGLREGRSGALAATIEALAPMGRPLERRAATEALGEALGGRDLERAADELERLAREAPSAAELARLREAMAAAADALDPEALRREREALEAQRERLLRRDDEERSMDEAERTVRDATRERELDRLRRDIEERREREEELEALRRELEELGRERGEPSVASEAERSAMERAAEALRRYADESADEREREELAREIEATRELVRRMRDSGGASGAEGEEGEGGSRMDRFVLRARGESEGGAANPVGTPGEAGEPGAGSPGEGSSGRGPEGAETSGEGPGERGDGEGGDRAMLALGAGDDRLLLPGGGAPRAGSDRAEEAGPRGEARAGAGAGTGAASVEVPSERRGEHTTVRVAGAAGAGPTRSEVIRTSAARGFASREYRDVYGDYRRHAEESLDDEAIPPGYRFYVERYFQLIRPRE
jgi:hypothetical protein